MGEKFLGLDFVDVALEQREQLTPFLERHPQPLSGYTFPTLAAWNASFLYRWAFAEPETLIISFHHASIPNRQILQPVGRVSAAVKESLIRAASALPYPLRILGVSEEFLREHSDLSAHFEVHEDIATSNYVYLASELAELPGRKFQPKRNLIAQATRLHPWTAEPITAANLDDTRAMIRKFREEECPILEGTLLQEARAVDFTLDHWAQLSQQGVLIRMENEPAAFALFERLGPKTAVMHFERALRRFKGAYQVVNREAAKMIRDQGYELINREEDLGDEGLRKAKLSYNPVKIEKAFQLVFQRR